MSRDTNTTVLKAFAGFVALLVLAAGGALVVSAASTYTISGTVTDSSGANVSDASIIAVNGNGTKLAETTTASDGSYSLSVTGGQDVTVKVAKSGYITAETTYSNLSANKTYSPTLMADSDGDGLADTSDAYPSYPRHEYTVSANTSKTVSSLYAEVNSTNEVTVTVMHNGTELSNKTVTPSSTPKTVEVNVSSTYSSYTVYVHGVSSENVSDTGVFYESDSTSGGTSGDSDSSGPADWASDNPAVAVLVGIVALGAAAVVREEL